MLVGGWASCAEETARLCCGGRPEEGTGRESATSPAFVLLCSRSGRHGVFSTRASAPGVQITTGLSLLGGLPLNNMLIPLEPLLPFGPASRAFTPGEKYRISNREEKTLYCAVASRPSNVANRLAP